MLPDDIRPLSQLFGGETQTVLLTAGAHDPEGGVSEMLEAVVALATAEEGICLRFVVGGELGNPEPIGTDMRR